MIEEKSFSSFFFNEIRNSRHCKTELIKWDTKKKKK